MENSENKNFSIVSILGVNSQIGTTGRGKNGTPGEFN